MERREWKKMWIANYDNVIWTCAELLSFCYLRNWHIGSMLSRDWLGKVGAKSD